MANVGLYNSDLTYEQRAELRKKRREGERDMTKQPGVDGSYSSPAPVNSRQQSTSKSNSRQHGSSGASLPVSSAGRNGAVIRPRSPNLTGIRIQAKNLGPGTVNPTTSSLGSDPLIIDVANGIARTVGSTSLGASGSTGSPQAGRSVLRASSPVAVGNLRAASPVAFGSIRSVSPITVGNHSSHSGEKATRGQRDLGAGMSGVGPSPRKPPGVVGRVSPEWHADTVTSEVAPRLHSPLEKRVASGFLANIINRHQERERSCSPSPSPLTPSPSPLSSSRQFSFPTTNTLPERHSPEPSSLVVSMTVVAGEPVSVPPRNVNRGPSGVITATRAESSQRESTLGTKDSAIGDGPTQLALADSEKAAETRGDGCSPLPILEGCGHPVQNRAAAECSLPSGEEDLMARLVSPTSPRGLQSPLVPVALSTLRQDETESGRISCMSDISCSSFEYESFQTMYNDVPPVAPPIVHHTQAPPIAPPTTQPTQTPSTTQTTVAPPANVHLLQDGQTPPTDTTSTHDRVLPAVAPMLDLSASSISPQLGAQAPTDAEVLPKLETVPGSDGREVKSSSSLPTDANRASTGSLSASGSYRPLSTVPGVPIVTRLGSSSNLSDSTSGSDSRGKRTKKETTRRRSGSGTRAKHDAKSRTEKVKGQKSRDLQKKSSSTANTPEVTRRSKLGVPTDDLGRTLSETALPPHNVSSTADKPPLRVNTLKLAAKLSPQRLSSASFRSGLVGGIAAPGRDVYSGDSGVGFDQVSMPNLCTANVTGAGLDGREGSPENLGWGSLKKQQAKAKSSSLKRFSLSMKNLVGVGAGKEKGTKATSWQFAPMSGSEVSLVSSGADSELQLLSMEEREAIASDIEIAPGASSLDHWLRSEGTPVLEVVESGIAAESNSDDDYQTASESESAGDYIRSSVSIISVPSDTLAREAGYQPKPTVPPAGAAKPPVNDPPLTFSAPQRLSVSTVEPAKLKASAKEQDKSVKDQKSKSKASKAEKGAKGAKSSRRLPLLGKKKETASRGSDPKKDTAVAKKKDSSSAKPAKKTSSPAKPRNEPRKDSPTSRTTGAVSVSPARGSPGASRPGSSHSVSSLESSPSGKLSPLVAKPLRSPTSSFRTSASSSPGSSFHTPASRSPNTSFRTSTSRSPTASFRTSTSLSPHSSFRTATTLSPSGSFRTNSPTAKTRVSPSVTPPPSSGYRIDSPLAKKSYPLSKTVKMEARAAERNSPQAAGSPKFSRFAQARVPVRKPTVSTSRAKSPNKPSASGSSLAERVERIREQRKAEKKGGLKKLSLSEGTRPLSAPGSPQAKSRSLSTSSAQSVLSQTTSSIGHSHSPTPSSPLTPGRRRKFGLSLHVTPGINVIESPINLSQSTSTEDTPRKQSTQQHEPAAAAATAAVASATATDSKSKEMDIDSLLTSVGRKLDMLQMPDSDTTGHGTGESDTAEAVLGVLEPLSSESQSTTSLVTLDSAEGLGEGSRPDLATMPASVFTISPSHSRQSSLDIDVERIPSPSNALTDGIHSAHGSTGSAPLLVPPPKPNVAVSPLHKARKVVQSGKITETGFTSTSGSTDSTRPTPSIVKVTASNSPAPAKQRVIPIVDTPATSSGRSSQALSSNKATPSTRAVVGKVGIATSSKVPVRRTLSPQTKSEPKLPSSPQHGFTAARPPKPPVGRLTKHTSDQGLLAGKGTPPSSPARTSRSSVDKAPVAGVTSMTGMRRPVSGSVMRKSTLNDIESEKVTGPKSAAPVSKKSPAASQPGVRAGGAQAKKTSIGGGILRKTSSMDTAVLKKTSNPLQQGSSVRRSVKSKSTVTRPRLAVVTPRKGSVPQLQGSLSRDSRHGSIGPSSGRRSMRRTSSGDIPKNKPIKPGTTATLRRGDRRSSQSSLNASMRVKTGMARPQSASTTNVRNSVATRSMRISRSSVGRKSVSGTATLPRGLTLSQRATPPSSSGASIHASPARKSLKKTSSKGDVFSVFDQISAKAQGSMLTSSDHRRAVRPKTRKTASTTHLKMLTSRTNVTSELSTAAPSEQEGDGAKVDPNTYSTYMGKKSLDHSAIAGLAAKLDLTTVKLRKTGIMNRLAEQGDEQTGYPSPVPGAGTEFDTTHTTMLLQVKGRRNIQTRLVEPSASSLNSGDVFIVLSGKSLFHWIGKSANIIEKARGSDVVMRILHKRELGCQATQAHVLKEAEASVDENTKRSLRFWELLGGKKGVKSSESAPSDDVYERAVNLSTQVFQLESDGKTQHFVPIQEVSPQMVKIALLNTRKILLFDFHSEVYVWIGKQSPGALRKKALELGKEHFAKPCRPPCYTPAASSTRASGRYRSIKGNKSPRHSILNSSGRRSSRVSRGESSPRPDWALFAKQNEGAESILFREKFSDWPEPGRIIKMKGHVSSGEGMPVLVPVELQPADVTVMLKPTPPFEGMRLEGENIHRGEGNYKVCRSSFACNRVRTNTLTKWVIKEFTNMLVAEDSHGIFYSQESYVLRWAFIITVVRELEGLTPGQGLFARDRQYKKDMEAKKKDEGGAGGGVGGGGGGKEEVVAKKKGDDSDSDSDFEASDEESQRVLESGGRDRCAYFFWQGTDSSLNEKGASALMTVELDKERGPQVRVVQGKEPATFLGLFQGTMLMLLGRSETDSLQVTDRPYRFFCVCDQERREAYLLEVSTQGRPLATCLRSRGCYVVYHMATRKVYLWVGSKVTDGLRRSASRAARQLRKRLEQAELVCVNEGSETKAFRSIVGDTGLYLSLLKESRLYDYTPRLFELGSVTGEFLATEILYPSRNNLTEAFPFLQSDIYSVKQPAIFLLDAHFDVYVWLGWWPEQRNKLLKEANATAGSAHARWLKDKKLALETAVNYAKACSRPHTPKTYLVHAGAEHEKFVNQFPFWVVNETVQEINCKGTMRPVPWRVEAEDELKKYSRTRFTVEELRKKPPPEGVDPSKLDTYLSDADFKVLFRITREQFQRISPWKQAEIKKRVGLF